MKIIKKVLIIVILLSALSKNVFAIGEILNTAEDWPITGRQHTSITFGTSKITKASSAMYNLLLAVATAVAVIVGAILGIKFMTAGIDKKVEVKETLFPYLISCTVVFGSFGIWKLAVEIMKNI